LLRDLDRFLRSDVLVDFRRCLPLASRKHANQNLLRGSNPAGPTSKL
jgi:hypothetical protein